MSEAAEQTSRTNMLSIGAPVGRFSRRINPSAVEREGIVEEAAMAGGEVFLSQIVALCRLLVGNPLHYHPARARFAREKFFRLSGAAGRAVTD